MPDEPGDPLAYYATHGPITDPGQHADLLEGLPGDLHALVEVAQGVLLHARHAPRYGIKLTPEREREVELRHVERMLARIRELDSRPLAATRSLDRRLVATSRDYSVLLAALARHQGIPAHARCGFATYFEMGHHEDHWACEVWDAGRGRWACVDSTLDATQRVIHAVHFDPLGVPPGHFLPAGQAWQLCRTGQADPDSFGIFHLEGLWFVRGNLVRDLAALNKVEMLPWDAWGLIEGENRDLSAEDLARLDRVAALSQVGNDGLSAIRAAFQEDGFCVPPVITCHSRSGAQKVTLEV
jgi:hypothetical protein